MAAALMSKVSGAVAAILWLGSAGLWAYSSSIEIREDLDAIVGDLQRCILEQPGGPCCLRCGYSELCLCIL